MPTKKQRINLTVPAELFSFIKIMAKHDESSISSTALEMLKQAAELEEDRILSAIAETREKKCDGTLISNEQAWK